MGSMLRLAEIFGVYRVVGVGSVLWLTERRLQKEWVWCIWGGWGGVNAMVDREKFTKGGCVVYIGWLGWGQCNR